ncbi:neuroligin-1-like isoform X1 [Odontomachus brunneus]|uniref:neuroligin-1-like isoform X1 n=1 Tax=Odontomachus brunneus TaxID=486640 RepID=UPI0013F19FF1|nr:neuroligin-1-like isoform X1 [Odontomachus brunneus]XP_032685514.1 neuroligin-1-like isoform X1 [Odontomachus brunneus]XP_032685516.1 neuroligin-1-like isoform X1 [Odontomachus brunneus]XP_032685517.1 neuroligin-1-like isoform X1 [Odontomachus brunneus]XP_032685518.1 neuroligin-1-like isoform X1 [Odontomachus brunneus]XP_032685519.1 neuroligin-1-like isoform X1 [Odontomachus brunneus]XP_032685520.1 neuroligin-1-like isoform X1 [Odontomachus brunneus]XP_032685521.1 neuroligin-1-like isofor
MLLPCQPAARSRPLVARTPIGPKSTRRSCVGLALLIVLLSLTDDGRAASQPATRYASRIVETKSGQIRGILQELNSRHLDPVEVFRGIPYAAPPVGDLRFRAPISPIPWNGVRLADTFGTVCPQNYPDIVNDTAALLQMPLGRYQQLKKMIAFLTNQSEDCLFLNLYIPGSGSRGLEAPYAVMVYVHGESFEWGSGNLYDGSVLASAGHVIVITLNYRLGILGFLRTRPFPDRTSGSGGNLALKDITMALRWVRENIGAFGGDPTRITIMGHDTGAALVNLLLLAPYSKGLFHRVVLSSGSALSPWASVHDPNDLRTKIGEQVGCPTDGDEDIANCLRGVPLETLMDVQLPEIRFVPRIGPGLPVDQNNPDPGLDMERASDAFIKVPLILGVSTTESNLDFNANDIQFGFEEDHRNRILRTFIRNAYVYHLNEIFSAVRNEYTDWDKPVLHPIIIRDSTMEALSDGHTVAPLMRIAFYHARRGAKTYFYHFNHQSKDSGYLQRLGSVRGEDIPYIFGLPLVAGGAFFPRNYSRQDQGVAEAVLTFFTNFAKTGNPNEPHKIESVDYGTPKEKTRFRGLTWEQYETGSQQYLTIALKPKMKSHYRGHKMAVWLNLIPQLHRPGDDDVSMRHHHFRERGDHYYAGPVRDEWYTPLPLTGTTRTSASSTTACSTSTGEESLAEDITPILDDSEDDAELLQRLASRHYYSTTTALAITVGVGCILLVLNMLIFAGIYYQRDRDKKRATMDCRPNGQESLPLTTRTSIKSSENPRPAQEPPPSYTTLARSPSIQEQHQQQLAQSPELQNGEQSRKESRSSHGTSNTIHKDPIPPKPPTRTTSSLSTSSGTNTIKKRVQIQEISV